MSVKEIKVGFTDNVLGREYTFASKGSRVKRNKKEIIANDKESGFYLVLCRENVESDFFSNHFRHR